PQWTGRMACAVHAKAQETDGTAAEAQGDIPPPPIPTSEPGDPVDQPDTTRLGQLLHGGTLQRVLSLRSKLGGKEGPAPHDEGSETQGLRLDRWSRKWLYDTLKLFNGYKVKWLQPKVAPAG